ncbi:MAG: HD domain-containing protein [Lachnospiraceae bacterium]|nr:HD domain-containing protein [Lachnospiraceae bacterium]
MVNQDIMTHGEITGYILAKMLECENTYTKQEIADYAMIAVLHDLGLFNRKHEVSMFELENTDVWAHSIYGYLFLKHLSPLGDMAEIILYHHLDYELYGRIKSKYMKVISYLNLADKMDTFMHARQWQMEREYFQKYRDIKFSGQALDWFYKTDAKYKILEKLSDGSYRMELMQILSERTFSNEYKKRYLELLIYTIDFRSEHTVDHTMATTTFAHEIGRCMRLSGYDQQNLYYGALLHDLGKLAIPVEILEAPRKLTDEEMRVMRMHVEITQDILEGIVSKEIYEIAIAHHEKIDGSGYPRGLKGDQLSITQRILAVADILSALYGKRSYKDSYDSEVIRKLIEKLEQEGKICPKVSGYVLRNWSEIIKNFDEEHKRRMATYLMIKEQYALIYEQFKNLK